MSSWLAYRKMRTTIDNRLKKYFKTDYVIESSPIIEKTKKQLTVYFKQEQDSFDIPLLFAGVSTKSLEYIN